MLVTVAAAAVSLATMNVMSFNIRFGTANDGEDRWELRRNRTMRMLADQKPDIVGLQEALGFQIDEIRAALPRLQAVGVGRDDGRNAGEYAAILYDASRFQALRADTFWLSDTPSVISSKGWGNQVTRICTWAYFRDQQSGRHFWHFNTHLDHQSQPSREKAIALILRRISERAPGDPVIVTGDFNASEKNPVIGQMRSGGFRDSWRVLNPTAPEPGTFSGFQEMNKEKIDYVWVDAGWNVTGTEVVLDKMDGHWPSDHAPVTAKLELADL